MLFYLCVILLCQLAGEALVALLGLPIPGPVAGMALLFVGLLIHGAIPEGLSKVGDGLLANLSLLFVPAGAGIVVHASHLKREMVPIAVALVISTLLAIAVTGVLMQWLSKNAGSAPDDPELDTSNREQA
ncbi:CidA/LrgA family protein [Cohaesibacter sp. ES.047]|uniref:CidA/LrgA family protein n=1 Tax=Cohaesibacter sp. ES.047 TaxID=1798205 RepID=UPI000BB8FDFC|nr:CidA/LrgA family protein [Cohaesibacter sp. ES.047]